MAAISARIPSTGRRARLVTTYVTPLTVTSSRGRPISMAVNAVSTALCSAESGAPA